MQLCSFFRSFLKGLLMTFLVGCMSIRAGAQRYPFFNIGVEQGLVQSQASSLVQDRYGQLWVGTLGGLACYDGHSFKNFSIRDGLPANAIKALSLDAHGNICIGTAKGLSVYNGHRFKNFRFSSDENPRGNTVWQLSLATNGTLWCLAGQSIYSVRDGKTNRLPPPHEDLRWAALRAVGNELWASPYVSRFLYRYHDNVWDSIPLPEPAPHAVLRITSNRNSQLTILTSRGVFQRQGETWQALYERHHADDPVALRLTQAADGSTWIATDHGALRLKDGRLEKFEKANGFTDVMVEALLCDAENNLWFGTNGEGLYRFSGAAFTAVDEHQGLEGTQVSSIATTTDGQTYFATFDGGLYRFEDGRAHRLRFPGVEEVTGVSSLCVVHDELWIGTHDAGLWRRNLKTGEMHQIVPVREISTVQSLARDSSYLWVSNGRDVFRMNGDKPERISLPTPVYCFALCGADSLLLSTPDGFQIYAHGHSEPFLTHSGADSAEIVCMEVRGQTIWIGTGDNGLYGMDRKTGRRVHFSRQNGLRSDFIYDLYPAPDGSVWVGTGFGICHILSPFDSSRVVFYGRNAGIVGMESNRNAVLPLPDGCIWFGTTGGAQLYDPSRPLAMTQPLSLQLDNVSLFGEPLRDTNLFNSYSAFFHTPRGLRLPYQKNSLSFAFTAITLSGNSGISYRYRLKGLNAPWSDWSGTNRVNYPALPPGKYVLEVECSEDGVHPMAARLSYPFEVITPFHKTGLFRLLMVLGLIILGVGLQYLAALGKRRRRAQLEAIRREEQAKVRQRTAEDFHDEVGNKLTRINVLTNVLRSKVPGNEDAGRIITQIQENAGLLYGGTRDILWSLQPSNDNLFQVLNHIRDFGLDLFGDTDTSFRMEPAPEPWKEIPLTIDVSRNLIMIFKEALNNALKHANASLVCVHCALEAEQLLIQISDDGNGFVPQEEQRGQGLNNMQTRAQRLNGTLSVQSNRPGGTRIHISIPMTRLMNRKK